MLNKGKLKFFEVIYPAVLIARKIYAPQKKEKPAPPATGKNPTEQEKADSAEMAKHREKREKQQTAKDGLKVVVNSAKISCNLCTNPIGTLMVMDPNPTACNQPIATSSDKQKTNLMFTGTCSKSPNSATPCTALIQPAMWQDTGSLKVQNKPPLLKQSTIKCLWGGVDIKFLNSGQMKPPFAFDAPGPKRETEPDESVNIRVSVFFDGTGNNKNNTECRHEYNKKLIGEPYNEKKASIYLTKHLNKEGLPKNDGSSYENDFSNVARLFKYYEEETSDPKNLTGCVYVEGIGTTDYGNDDLIPQGLGYDILTHSGVLEKVKSGCNALVVKICKISKSKPINQLTIDVFGFSRGAAAARNFLYEIKKDHVAEQIIHNDEGYDTIIEESPQGGHFGAYLKEKGVKINIDEMKISFAGLFDTVASYGLHQKNNVSDLNLNAVKNAKHILHLTAMDERRAKFTLITVSGKGSECEKSLPGVHSDVGGCYNPDIVEEKSAVFVGGEKEAEKESEYLIEDGWYSRDQINIHSFFTKTFANLFVSVVSMAIGKGDYIQYKRIHGLRKNIKQDYSFIPLHIMGKAAKAKRVNIKFKSEFDTKFNIPAKLEYINKRLNDYVFNGAPLMRFINRSELDRLIYMERTSIAKSKNSITFMPKLEPGLKNTIYENKLIDSIDNIIEGTKLNPNEFTSNPKLKILIEDHLALLELRSKYLHISHNCSLTGTYVSYYDPYTKSIRNSTLRHVLEG